LRSFVVRFKNQVANVKELASAMRLDKRLKMLGLDQNHVEVLLDNVAEHCFKKGITTEEFTNNVNEVTRISNKIECL
jgi:hypothetical protein